MTSLGPTGLTLRDVSGNKNHGVLTGMDPATDWVVDDVNKLGYVLDYDGVNDHVSIPGAPPLTDWTLSVWVKPGSTTDNRYISDFSGGNEAAMLIGYQDGFYNIFGGPYPTGTASDSQIPITGVDIWDLVTWTKNGTNIRGYVNGVEETSVTQTTGDFTPSAGLEIAATGSGGAPHFLGRLGPYLLYDHALSHNEIQQLFVDPFSPFRRRIAMPVSSPAVAVDITHVAATAIEPLGLVTLPPSVTSY